MIPPPHTHTPVKWSLCGVGLTSPHLTLTIQFSQANDSPPHTHTCQVVLVWSWSDIATLNTVNPVFSSQGYSTICLNQSVHTLWHQLPFTRSDSLHLRGVTVWTLKDLRGKQRTWHMYHRTPQFLETAEVNMKDTLFSVNRYITLANCQALFNRSKIWQTRYCKD